MIFHDYDLLTFAVQLYQNIVPYKAKQSEITKFSKESAHTYDLVKKVKSQVNFFLNIQQLLNFLLNVL